MPNYYRLSASSKGTRNLHISAIELTKLIFANRQTPREKYARERDESRANVHTHTSIYNIQARRGKSFPRVYVSRCWISAFYAAAADVEHHGEDDSTASFILWPTKLPSLAKFGLVVRSIVRHWFPAFPHGRRHTDLARPRSLFLFFFCLPTASV